jgi:hypothetical protein
VARVGRLAGALLAETGGVYFLVGDLKEPCDFARAGFVAPPADRDVHTVPYVRLEPTGAVSLAAPWLTIEVEGEALARLLAERLVIARNGSVSERLWRVVTHAHEGASEVPARWLGEVPQAVWNLVRESVLKCS